MTHIGSVVGRSSILGENQRCYHIRDFFKLLRARFALWFIRLSTWSCNMFKCSTFRALWKWTLPLLETWKKCSRRSLSFREFGLFCPLLYSTVCSTYATRLNFEVEFLNLSYNAFIFSSNIALKTWSLTVNYHFIIHKFGANKWTRAGLEIYRALYQNWNGDFSNF